jgi:hypothetical protein
LVQSGPSWARRLIWPGAPIRKGLLAHALQTVIGSIGGVKARELRVPAHGTHFVRIGLATRGLLLSIPDGKVSGAIRSCAIDAGFAS